MPLPINPAVAAVAAPPIAEAMTWIEGVALPPDRPLLDLAQAVPSYPPPEDLRAHVAQAALGPSSAFYTAIMGKPELRGALAAHLSEDYRADLSADQVGITAGANHAFCLATQAVAGSGDAVLLAEPAYFNHAMWFAMQGIEAIALPCRAGGEGMVPDPAEARALITPRTRAICLVTPNNPTGTIYSSARLKAFYDLARDHGLALVLDETYKDFRPDPAPPHGLFGEPGWQEVVLQVYSFSKVYSLTGYRVGSLTGGRRVMAEVAKIADTLTICPPHLGQVAALYGLAALAPWRAQKRDEALARIEALDAAFARHRPAFEMVSRGAFFAYVRHPFEGRSAEEVAKALVAKQSLFCLPGRFFGADQERYLRLAFANAAVEEMDEIAGRLAAFEGLEQAVA